MPVRYLQLVTDGWDCGMRESIIADKSFRFAVKVVELYKVLTDSKKEYVLSKQLLRSGTSIGANIKEAQEAQSKNDFISKMSIALKEAVETEYWIELMRETQYLDVEQAEVMLSDLGEIIKMINKIIKTTKENLVKKN